MHENGERHPFGRWFGGSTNYFYRRLDAQGNPLTDQTNLTPGSVSLTGGSTSFPLGENGLGFLVELPTAGSNDATVNFGTTSLSLVRVNHSPLDQRVLGSVSFDVVDPCRFALAFKEDFQIVLAPGTVTSTDLDVELGGPLE